jgi:hypothetical protein
MGQEEIENDISIEAYPNPTSDFFTVTIQGYFPSKGHIEFALFDSSGKTVKQTYISEPTFVIDASDLPKGNYIYRIGSRKMKQGKIVII